MTTQAEDFAELVREADKTLIMDEEFTSATLSAEEFDAHCLRFGDKFRVAEEEFNAVLEKKEPVPCKFHDEVLTTWRFPDNSLAVILGYTDNGELCGGVDVVAAGTLN